MIAIRLLFHLHRLAAIRAESLLGWDECSAILALNHLRHVQNSLPGQIILDNLVYILIGRAKFTISLRLVSTGACLRAASIN
jgi:hypothetical protein